MEATTPPRRQVPESLRARTLSLSGGRAAVGASAKTWKTRSHFWLRWAHVYISMFSLLFMLFFGLTGITLNHPDWSIGDPKSETIQGTLPDLADDGQDVELLAISEFVRDQHGIAGDVADFTAPENGQGSIAYRSPGYSANLFFDTNAGTYDLTVDREGVLGVMNELHRGRDSDSTWRWVIDVAGGLLVAVALTGLGIQIFLKKRRGRALTLSLVGGLVTIILIWLAAPGGFFQ